VVYAQQPEFNPHQGWSLFGTPLWEKESASNKDKIKNIYRMFNVTMVLRDGNCFIKLVTQCRTALYSPSDTAASVPYTDMERRNNSKT
jgi:hypothetical protein